MQMAVYRDAVVTSCNANWLPAAAVALWSIARHGLPENIDLVIFVHGSNAEDRANLDVFNRRHGTAIKLVPVEMQPPPSVDLGHWGVGTILMLQLDRYIDHPYRRVLHVDVDVLAYRPIQDLLETDLRGRAFGAVDEVHWLNGTRRSSPGGIGMEADAPYFNAGVLLFDWREIVDRQLLPKGLQLLANGARWPLLNQDVLNVVSAGQWWPLDLRWNVTTTIAQYRNIDPWIRHFTSSAKPWTESCRHTEQQYRTEYVRAFEGTNWEDFVHPGGGRWSRALFIHLIRRRFAFGRQRRLTRALRAYSTTTDLSAKQRPVRLKE